MGNVSVTKQTVNGMQTVVGDSEERGFGDSIAASLASVFLTYCGFCSTCWHADMAVREAAGEPGEVNQVKEV